jgi:hypothetical protein
MTKIFGESQKIHFLCEHVSSSSPDFAACRTRDWKQVKKQKKSQKTSLSYEYRIE